MIKRTVEELAEFIAKNISYDASEIASGVKCPHCGKMAREAMYNRWIDHQESLVSNIERFLGFRAYDKLREQWKLNALHTPNLKLCYNGFESITIKEYPAE